MKNRAKKKVNGLMTLDEFKRREYAEYGLDWDKEKKRIMQELQLESVVKARRN